jgi:hypothetical protein
MTIEKAKKALMRAKADLQFHLRTGPAMLTMEQAEEKTKWIDAEIDALTLPAPEKVEVIKNLKTEADLFRGNEDRWDQGYARGIDLAVETLIQAAQQPQPEGVTEDEVIQLLFQNTMLSLLGAKKATNVLAAAGYIKIVKQKGDGNAR